MCPRLRTEVARTVYRAQFYSTHGLYNVATPSLTIRLAVSDSSVACHCNVPNNTEGDAKNV